MSNEMETLNPCPFCGGAAAVVELESEDETGENGGAPFTSWYRVACVDGCADSSGAQAREIAVLLWNRRARVTCDRCDIWAMFAKAAAKALEPMGEAFAFDDPDSLEGAITRLVALAQTSIVPQVREEPTIDLSPDLRDAIRDVRIGERTGREFVTIRTHVAAELLAAHVRTPSPSAPAENEVDELTTAIDAILAEHGLDMDATSDRVEGRVLDLIRQLSAPSAPEAGSGDDAKRIAEIRARPRCGDTGTVARRGRLARFVPRRRIRHHLRDGRDRHGRSTHPAQAQSQLPARRRLAVHRQRAVRFGMVARSYRPLPTRRAEMTDEPEVSPTCEVITEWDYKNKQHTFCGATTTHWYPTKNGTMALCNEHAQRHLPHGAWPIGTPCPWPTKAAR